MYGTDSLCCIYSARSCHDWFTAPQATQKWGTAVRCYRKTFQPLFNLIGESHQEVLLKLVVEPNSDRILGAHMVGNGAANVIQMIGPALRAGVTKQDFDHSSGIHPSIAEALFTGIES